MAVESTSGRQIDATRTHIVGLDGRALEGQRIAFRWIRCVAYGEVAVQQHERLEQILRGERPRSRPRESQASTRGAAQASRTPKRRRRTSLSRAPIRRSQRQPVESVGR